MFGISIYEALVVFGVLLIVLGVVFAIARSRKNSSPKQGVESSFGKNSNPSQVSSIGKAEHVQITRDIVVDGALAFRRGDTVRLEAISPHVSRPEYKYVVTSRLLGKKFYLSDNDVTEPQMSSSYPQVFSPPSASGDIQSYQQLPTGINFAGFWIRFVAELIDELIWIAALIPLALISSLARSSEAVGIVVGLIAWAALVGYHFFMVARYGATFGKKALGLKVIRQDGAPMTDRTALVRALSRCFLSGCCFGIGFIIAGFDSQKRALHDHIAKTYVVFKTPAVAQAPYQHAVPPPSGTGRSSNRSPGPAQVSIPAGMPRYPRKKFPVWATVLIVVIAIFVVILAVPVHQSAKRNAEGRTCQSNLRTIEGAMSTYYAEAEVYPDDISDMTSGPYQVLNSALQCPTNGNYYELEAGTPPTVACPDSIEGHVI
ncbi:MAG: RDD family protein [Actinobacteria bacterium]|nr:RDD family protein [Actinomycetota bacterium]MBU4179302.1 RDD family protein [Actinomycetota bacterium]MBU4218379.1 RDD family protein [Actinomycetota bacterium]MBU4359820.1 RDD family protein [Actinomycetota bacterium]